MSSNKKEQVVKLLKGIETGDPASVSAVNEAQYIQHNPQTHEGSEGLAELFKRLSKTSPRVNIVRVFEDGDFVFAHTEYDCTDRNIGFEFFVLKMGKRSNIGIIFKIEKDQIALVILWYIFLPKLQIMSIQKAIVGLLNHL